MTDNPVMQALKGRRSTRVYDSRPVEKALLEQIVEAGRYAPSASNQQKWHFTVVTCPKALDQLAAAAEVAMRQAGRELPENYRCNYHAPALIIVSLPSDYAFLREDGACALQNMFLAAHSLGLGSCWINQFGNATGKHPAVREALDAVGVPEDHAVCGCAAVGYGKAPTPLRPRVQGNVHFVE